MVLNGTFMSPLFFSICRMGNNMVDQLAN